MMGIAEPTEKCPNDANGRKDKSKSLFPSPQELSNETGSTPASQFINRGPVLFRFSFTFDPEAVIFIAEADTSL